MCRNTHGVTGDTAAALAAGRLPDTSGARAAETSTGAAEPGAHAAEAGTGADEKRAMILLAQGFEEPNAEAGRQQRH
jgi:hypothetical protein